MEERGHIYEPDFVVETEQIIYLVEVKGEDRTLKKSQFLKSLSQLHEGGAWQDLFGWDKQVAPLFIAVGFAPAGSRLAVLYTALFLGDYIRIVQFILAFRKQKIKRRF